MNMKLQRVTNGVIVAAMLLAAGCIPLFAHAEVDIDAGVNVKADVGMEQKNEHAAVTTQAEATLYDEETMEDDMKDDNGSGKNANANTGTEMSAEHRSAVAIFVKNLLSLADRDGGIGAEVRAVAKEQQDSADANEEAMTSIENRASWKTFLFGTDYKSIGVLRSGLVTTENHISRLEAAKERSTNASVKAGLDTEIKALTDVHAELEAFVETNENKLSIFGWVVRKFQ